MHMFMLTSDPISLLKKNDLQIMLPILIHNIVTVFLNF